MIFLMVSWLDIPGPTHEIEVMELFAGVARLTRLAKALGIPAQAHDVLFDCERANFGKSCMDISDPAGYLPLILSHQIQLSCFDMAGFYSFGLLEK